MLAVATHLHSTTACAVAVVVVVATVATVAIVTVVAVVDVVVIEQSLATVLHRRLQCAYCI